jgi:hypothetical protein
LRRGRVRKLDRRRVDHEAETVMDGAEAAGIPLEEVIDRGVADDRRHELFARTLTIAQDTALRNKGAPSAEPLQLE